MKGAQRIAYVLISSFDDQDQHGEVERADSKGLQLAMDGQGISIAMTGQTRLQTTRDIPLVV